jgi:hypothetical protein
VHEIDILRSDATIYPCSVLKFNFLVIAHLNPTCLGLRYWFRIVPSFNQRIFVCGEGNIEPA